MGMSACAWWPQRGKAASACMCLATMMHSALMAPLTNPPRHASPRVTTGKTIPTQPASHLCITIVVLYIYLIHACAHTQPPMQTIMPHVFHAILLPPPCNALVSLNCLLMYCSAQSDSAVSSVMASTRPETTTRSSPTAQDLPGANTRPESRNPAFLSSSGTDKPAALRSFEGALLDACSVPALLPASLSACGIRGARTVWWRREGRALHCFCYCYCTCR